VAARPGIARKIRIRKWAGRWEWECTLCHPAVIGSTMSWRQTLASAARHCRRTRPCHHVWVLQHKGPYLP
jgi:hypothetical protein